MVDFHSGSSGDGNVSQREFYARIKPVLAEKVIFDKTEVRLKVGDPAVRINATIDPTYTTDKVLTWDIDDNTIISGNTYGSEPMYVDIQALKIGTTRVTAKTNNDIVGVCNVIVEQ